MVVSKALGLRRLHVTVPGKNLPQPRHTLLFGFRALILVGVSGFLVSPVRGHTKFCKFMHRTRADLNFDRFSRGVSHHRMQRLVPVGFRVRDVVVILFT